MKIPIRLDFAATVGVLLSALATALPCCLPSLASLGATLGLGLLTPYQDILNNLLQGLVALALISHILSFRRHRNAYLMALVAASALLLFYAYNIELSSYWVYSGLAGLVTGAAWSYGESRLRGACQPSVQTRSTLTCPHCGHLTTATMPADACQYFYECPACKRLLKPKLGDCCVFCSYGDVPCPPKQVGMACRA